MISQETAAAADALLATIALADGAGLLHQLLPEVLPLLGRGMALAQRELHLAVIEQELG